MMLIYVSLSCKKINNEKNPKLKPNVSKGFSVFCFLQAINPSNYNILLKKHSPGGFGPTLTSS